MGLRTKFNLAMLAAFATGLALASTLAYHLLQENAQREVLQEASIMLAGVNAVTAYTDGEVSPLLLDQLNVHFLPQAIPFAAAHATFRMLQSTVPEYTSKFAVTNPTNPDDRATQWEQDIIDTFQRSPRLTELISERAGPTGPILSRSLPIRITDKSCLQCHSRPAAAPASMVALYGPTNGFGWKLGDLVGAEIVSVPERVPLERARHAFLAVLGGLLLVFAIMMGLLNLLLHYVIVRPVRAISAMATEVSTGNLNIPEFEVRGNDEIASLMESFNRMRRSIANALKMLGET